MSAEDRERLKAYVLETAPADMKKLDINFQNQVHLVGYRLEPETAGPGAQVKVTFIWRCDEALDDGWQLFTHVQHEGYEKPDNIDGNGPLREKKNGRQVMGPDRWERGKFYVDEQIFTMPADLRGPESVIYTGIWKPEGRLRIVSGPTDGENRAIVAKIKTGIASKNPEAAAKKRGDLPSMRPMKLPKGEKITIDGKGDEKVWADAATTGPYVDVSTGKPNSGPVSGSTKMLWDDENLYALVEIIDPDVTGFFTDKDAQPKNWTVGGQPMTWTKDCAEMMVDPDGDGDNVNYFELQWNPANKVFKSQFDTYNKPKTEPQGPFGHEDWDPKMKSAVVVKGTIDNPDDHDTGYTVEVAIPWRAFEKGAKQLPPNAGDTWRMNFYAMETNGGPAWSPILGQGNFHKSSRFGHVQWVTKEWMAAQSADAGAPDGGGAGDAGASDAGKTDAGRTMVDAGLRPLRP